MSTDPENATNPDNEQTTAADSATTPQDSTAASETLAASASRSSGKKSKSKATDAKPVYGKLRFALTQETEKAVRYTVLMTEGKPNALDPTQLVEEAVLSYLRKLRSKGMEFPKSILPE